jgi:N-acetylmuramoyl-L-alanine amidase
VRLLAMALLAGSCTPATSPARGAEPAPTSSTFVTGAGSSAMPVAPPDDVAASTGRAPTGPLAGRRICLDPGHDATWDLGATGYDRDGNVPVHPTEGIRLDEHELTLQVAYRLAGLLEQDGATVCVTRKEDGSLQIPPYDFTGDGQVRTEGEAIEDSPERIQPRIDWANAAGAEVLVSLHLNGVADPEVRGTEVYYSDVGPAAAPDRALADALLAGLLDDFRDAGYDPVDRGVRGDRYDHEPSGALAAFLEHNAATIVANGADPADCPDCERLGVLGHNPMALHLGTYVGALVEMEFLSNADVVESLLLRPDAVDVLAGGLADGLLSYFRDHGPG